MPSPTLVTVLTPPGRSAVAVVRVEGPRACEAVDALFLPANGQPLGNQPLNHIRFGRWLHANGEELIVCRASATVVEVHCHGGFAAVRGVVGSLTDQGCVEHRWREEEAPGGVQAEAKLALAVCTTERAAAILLDQYHGALERSLHESIERIDRGDFVGALAAVTRLMENSEVGSRLTRPWRVVLAGPPNVGKSSLINALVGYERSIVFDQPGVTRDVVTASASIDGWPVEFADTAGLRPGSDALENAGVELAHAALADGELVLLLQAYAEDTEMEPWGIAPEQFLENLGAPPLSPEQKLILVANKLDLASDASRLSAPPGVLPVSAATGEGLDRLVGAIGSGLVPTPPVAGEAVPFTREQGETLRQVAAGLEASDTARAKALLLAMLSAAK